MHTWPLKRGAGHYRGFQSTGFQDLAKSYKDIQFLKSLWICQVIIAFYTKIEVVTKGKLCNDF